MSPDLYVLSIVDGHTLPTVPAYKAGQGLFGMVTDWAKRYLLEIDVTGSYAKGTRIKGSTDLDLLVSLGPRTPGTIKQVHDNLFVYLRKKGYAPRRNGVAVTIAHSGFCIDLVPARRQWGAANNHELFESHRQRPKLTNLDVHVKAVRDSGRAKDIMAVKIWRNLHGVRFPSLYLELTVLHVLRTSSKTQHATNFLKVLEYFRDEFVSQTVVDPANPKNVISDDLLVHEKMALSYVAEENLRHSDLRRIIR